VSNHAGTLYIIATPIGNLEDLSPRARRLLGEVALIAAEDTRHSGALARHFGIHTPMVSLHEHNERERVPQLIDRLRQGDSVAVVSDAGTPLVSDPGYRLVRTALGEGLPVVPVPGPCAAIAALSVSGLPSDRFVFEGFPPAKAGARREYLRGLKLEARTLIFYESAHRIVETLADMAEEFGAQREAVLARELTKQFETVKAAPLGEIARWVTDDTNQQKGEFVVVVRGAEVTAGAAREFEAERLLRVLLRSLPASQAAAAVAELTGLNRQDVYRQALALKG
jgi:16S rRNA (cytidine1402-2'-O)-methyltransferase